MNGKQIVSGVACALIAFSLCKTISNTIANSNLDIQGTIGMIINIVIAVFLIRGANWARWITIVKCGFVVVFGFAGIFSVFSADTSVVIRLVLGILGTLYIAISALTIALLLLSRRVNDHFGT